MPDVLTKPAKLPSARSAQPDILTCYHCGEDCPDGHIHLEDKFFCCEGCKMVYEILNDNGLCRYYDLDEKAGVSLKGKKCAEYAFLDDPDVQQRLIDFSDGDLTRVTFHIPGMHCASCIWLLENLYRLQPGVRHSSVNFPKKEVYITFSASQTSLRKIVELLSDIGYEPAITLSDLDQEKRPLVERGFYYKLGVAGFAFGNIMLLSFPEYLGLEQATDGFFHRLFGYLNILLSLPVILFSGRDYLHSAWTGLRQRQLTIDVPLALGMLVLFTRSTFEILTHTGAGYMDSLAGLVFFLLVGRWFQQKTYHHISFERDYKSYFPIAASKKVDGQEVTVPLDKLSPGDTIVIRHKELIPADGILLRGEGLIDYSFVTGEAEPVLRQSGEKLYAGGRQVGGDTIEVSLTRKVSQSYLTQLWNDEAFTKKTESYTSRIANRIGKYFTGAILFIALVTLLYWLPRNVSIAFNAFTAVLIIACPCAVALAVPFIFGNVLRILARHQFYLKNTAVIESLEEADTVVFDKTGTITQRQNSEIWFVGEPLSFTEKQMLYAAVSSSTHPVSRCIATWLQEQNPAIATACPAPLHWRETTGKGVEAVWSKQTLRLGNKAFFSAEHAHLDEHGAILQVNGAIRGVFHLNHYLRPGTEQVLNFFASYAPIHLLSGDNDREKQRLAPLFGQEQRLHFRQSPQDKLRFVKNLQQQGYKVLMLGDGLNDAGALQQSDIGIVLAEDTNNFTPACDAILHAARFEHLPAFIRMAQRSTRLVYYAYGLAFVYNAIGLSFAVQGALAPVVAAILMPASSITIVLFGILSSNWMAHRLGLRGRQV